MPNVERWPGPTRDRIVPPDPRPWFALLDVDGGARGAPEAAAIGYLISDEWGVTLAEHAESIGTATAAEAEYRALLAGLGRARQLGLTQVTARSDSRLLIAHVDGEHQTRNGRLRALAAEITDQRMRIGTVVFERIPAAANQEAHPLLPACWSYTRADGADSALDYEQRTRGSRNA
jgi:ribonuclease H / adenosylcobalamin/alpha-ribazole phosphatase